MNPVEFLGAVSTESDTLLECAFDGTFVGERASTKEFAQLYPALRMKGQVLETSPHFVLIPDIAPVSADHLLLLPMKHLPSFSSIPESLVSEATQLLSVTISKMQDLHPESEILVFEHGVGEISGRTIRCGGCGRTDHAHLHILPVPKAGGVNIGQTIATGISQTIKVEPVKIPGPPNIDLYPVAGHLPYLYLWSNRMRSALLFLQNAAEISVPSQLIRQLFAAELFGVTEDQTDLWDWRDYIFFHAKDAEKIVSATIAKWRC